MEEQLKIFVDNMIRQMAKQDLTPAQLISKAEISQKTYSNLVNMRHSPQLDGLVRIANALKVEMWRMWVPKTHIQVEGGEEDTLPDLVDSASELKPDDLRAVAQFAAFQLRNSKTQ